jgi:hypothetical protein
MDICNSSIQHINDMNNTFIGGVKETIMALTIKLTESIDMLTSENKSVKETNQVLIEQVASLEVRLKDLSRDLENSQEEQRQLLKVSRVVAIEKDNARLRVELQQLEAKFQLLKCSKTHIVPSPLSKEEETHNERQIDATPTIIHPVIQQVNAIGNDTKTELYHEEEALNVREKTIKGISYYLSDDNNVYEKNDDESIGELLGRIDGKKVKWF